MTTGTGLFVFGAWMVWVAAYAAPSVNERGVKAAKTAAWTATAIGLILTAASHPIVLAHAL